ncbi:MAG TPA: AAA-like domain-containing protein [Blastocatellia bacterium]|nr:AAA-like domain-containing protein [Blastocatellia bacterium]
MTNRRLPRFYEFGPFRVDTVKRLLSRDGKLVAIKPKVFDTLIALVQQHGEVVEKDALMARLWPNAEVEEGNITFNISALRNTLGEEPDDHRYVVTLPRRGYRFVATVRELNDEGEWFSHPAGGALPLDSNFYIERSVDNKIRSAISRQDSLVLLEGPGQAGKTSLLARGLQVARAAGAQVIMTDLQQFNAAYLESIEKLLLTLAESMAHELELNSPSDRRWNFKLSPNLNLDRYLRHEVLAKISSPIVWCLDNVDRLFHRDYGSEFFELLRSWHNNRALDPEGRWHNLTLVLAYQAAAERSNYDAHRWLFNLGTQLILEDFNFTQLSELNRRYDCPLRNEGELERFFGLVGGQPYLTNAGLAEMRRHQLTLSDLETQMALNALNEGWFSHHLRRMLDWIIRDQVMGETVRNLLRGQSCPDADRFYQLRNAGVLIGSSLNDARLRCQLYAGYFERNLCLNSL